MNLENLNKWLMLAANLGVITGIIFLALEMNQNNEILQANTRQAALSTDLDSLSNVMNNPDLWINLNNPEMTDEEKIQLSAYLISVVAVLEIEWLQYQSGALDEAAWLTSQSATADLLSYSESRKWWNVFKTFDFDPELVTYIDNLLINEPIRERITDVAAFDEK